MTLTTGHARVRLATLTIEGDRQSGKTETLIRLAVDDARRGRRVLYVTYLQAVATETFHRIVKTLDDREVRRVLMSRGNERIELTNGGLIDVRAERSDAAHRGISVDTIAIDDADQLNEDTIISAIVCTNASHEPRVYIARCT